MWVLIPLGALSIPILAIVDDSPIGWFFGLIALVGALTLSARHLMQFRHDLRLEEVAAQERLSIAERDRFTAVDRLFEPDQMPRAPRSEEVDRG